VCAVISLGSRKREVARRVRLVGAGHVEAASPEGGRRSIDGGGILWRGGRSPRQRGDTRSEIEKGDVREKRELTRNV
jgi:hypothetical protein